MVILHEVCWETAGILSYAMTCPVIAVIVIIKTEYKPRTCGAAEKYF